MAKVRNIHVVPTMDNLAAGITYSVSELARALAAFGCETAVFTTGRLAEGISIGAAAIKTFDQDVPDAPILKRLCASRGLGRSLAPVGAQAPTVVHTHGLWTLPSVYPTAAARAGQTKLMIAPHGMLGAAALTFSPLKKRLFMALAQKANFDVAACYQASAESEYDEIRAFGLKGPIAIVPNGIVVPADAPKPPPQSPMRTILSLGRLHPKKALDQLIAAWARLEPHAPDWQVKIVGPSEIGYLQTLQRQVSALNLRRVHFEEGQFGPAKERTLRAADVFVLPTLNENFGLVVGEALAVGVPVITTKGAPWQGLETHRCGWWVDHGVDPLEAALRAAMATPADALAAMGARGRAWMQRDFSWDHIAAEMASVYEWPWGMGDRPACVRL